MSERQLKAAELRGAKKIDHTADKIRAAMDLIFEEMKRNSGIYPLNGGAVTQAELYRRAEVSETTIYKPQHSELKKKITEWLAGLKKKEIVGRARVRRTYVERAEDWKSRYLSLQDYHILVELELQNNQSELEKSIAENVELKIMLEQYKAS